MNDLGLPRFDGRGEPPFAADETAYGAVVRRATNRRRTRAVAGTSTTAALAVAAVAVLSAPNGTASLAPADPPASSASASPSGSPTPFVPALGGTTLPTLPPLPGSEPSPGPEPTATATPRESAKPKPSHKPGEQPQAEWRVSWRFVDDRPGESCQRLAAPYWCVRYVGPMTVKGGESSSFDSEMCRMSTARSDGRIDFEDDYEAVVVIGRPNDKDAPGASSMRSIPVDDPHARTVRPGTCVRWTHQWNGLDHDSRPMAAGTYTLGVMVRGETAAEGPVGNGQPTRMWSVIVEGFEVT